jgi:hypothetical protein
VPDNIPEKQYSADELVKISLTEAILLRPKLWTRTGTFDAVVAFLDGRFSARMYGSQDEERTQWTAFWKWLADKSGLDNHRVQERIIEQSGSDEKAIAELLRLYAEFKAESEDSSPADASA